MEQFNTYDQFNRYKLENIKQLFIFALLVVPAMAFSDASLAGGDFWFYFGIRCASLFPYIIIYLNYKKLNPDHVDLYGFIIFIGIALGASLPSYFFGGLKSDYYFGIIVISFVQFITTPLNIRRSIIVEILYILIYFPLNTIGFDHPEVLITKQLSNFLSFAVIKVAVSDRFHNQFLESFKTIDLNRRLEKKETVQIILGELCHLLNNPLFISTSLIKRLKKKGEFQEEPDLNKAIEANDRMQEILKEMLKLQEQGEIEIQNNQVLKEFFEDTDIQTKLPKQ